MAKVEIRHVEMPIGIQFLYSACKGEILETYAGINPNVVSFLGRARGKDRFCYKRKGFWRTDRAEMETALSLKLPGMFDLLQFQQPDSMRAVAKIAGFKFEAGDRMRPLAMNLVKDGVFAWNPEEPRDICFIQTRRLSPREADGEVDAFLERRRRHWRSKKA